MLDFTVMLVYQVCNGIPGLQVLCAFHFDRFDSLCTTPFLRKTTKLRRVDIVIKGTYQTYHGEKTQCRVPPWLLVVVVVFFYWVVQPPTICNIYIIYIYTYNRIYIYMVTPPQDLPISFFNGIYSIKCLYIYIFTYVYTWVFTIWWLEKATVGN